MFEPLEQRPFTRRTLLRYGGAAAAGLTGAGHLIGAASALARPLRLPDSLPDRSRPAGTVDASMPFDHVVVVMMENHSFDNVLGALAHSGQPKAHGLRLNRRGIALNSNPGPAGPVRSWPIPTTAQPAGPSQSWNATHEEMDGGKMDGFARQGLDGGMGYWTEDVLPLPYSLARTFCVANRWFSSAPCQTYPNRRFLMAGTAYGNISTSLESLKDPPPPNGTIWDRLHHHEISWRNYFTDLPSTGIISSTVEKYPGNLAPIAQFFADCSSGSLPAVSLVDPEFGVVGEVGSALAQLPALAPIAEKLQTTGGDEEAPQDMAYGEYWAYQAIDAVLRSPAWPRTLLIYTYDEHGGYYDHVAPPEALAPDSIPPKLGPNDVPGGYDVYGPRVPAIVLSPYSKANAVTNVVHDHTSFLATVEAKWNLPAMTYRDANARTVEDFLDVSRAAFLNPPTVAEPPAPVGAATNP
ncbi:MAG: phospholipase [Solirubrobacteraceae bacterium]|jgi:phospholipase C|nr:phospholipase [Solirubrobacteraceae bacterium]